MLDIKFIRKNQKIVEKKSKQKGYPVDISKLIEVDNKRRNSIETVDSLRIKRKEAASSRNEAEGSKIKKDLKKAEDDLEKLNEEFYLLIREVPNVFDNSVPIGDEKSNKTIKEVGKKPKFDFKPKDHLELGVGEDLIDMERAAKISGSRFTFLKNEAVILEFALIRLALDTLTSEGFIPVVPPVLVNKKTIEGLGYPEYESGEGYVVDDQVLVGTAEHSLVPMHSDEILNKKDLPIRYTGFSTAFRKEAGSYGKDTKGIFRLHQFDKVEMVSLVEPKNDEKEHEYLLSQEEKLFKMLEIPYQVVNIASADLGFPAAKKYDIEAWIPSQNKYREVTSVSTTTDFQSRRLNIKFTDGKEKNYVHILNGTAFAIGRTLIAIVENYQQKDGSIKIPEALVKYTGFSKIPS